MAQGLPDPAAHEQNPAATSVVLPLEGSPAAQAAPGLATLQSGAWLTPGRSSRNTKHKKQLPKMPSQQFSYQRRL